MTVKGKSSKDKIVVKQLLNGFYTFHQVNISFAIENSTLGLKNNDEDSVVFFFIW